MEERHGPDNREGEQDRRAKVENAAEICPKRHAGERDGRGKSHRGRNESRHEPERGMINLREKMVLPSGTRQRGAEFAITKRAAKRRHSANDPKHEQRKSRSNVRQWPTAAREDPNSDKVGNNDGRDA